MIGKEFENFVLPEHGEMDGHQETKSRKLQIESNNPYAL
jgi:hypothetical protein